MTERNALRALCARYGVALAYTDINGICHEASDETLRSMLQAMGLDASGEAAARRTLDETEIGDWRRLLPPVRVLDVRSDAGDIELCLPERHAEAAWYWCLDEESGHNEDGEFTPQELPIIARRRIEDGAGGAGTGGEQWLRLRLPLPAVRGTGYHRFRVDGPGLTASTLLVAAPGTCYQPEGLAMGRRSWGIAAQLYALRSRRNWGIGDFTDLSRLVDLAAREGAGLVGINPLHALFPHAPGRKSPYSPSDRSALNVFCIDVEATDDWLELTGPGGDTAALETAGFGDNAFEARLRALRAAGTLDYAAVCDLKLEAFEALYANFRREHVEKNSERAARFREFCSRRGERLRRHALFCALSEHFTTAQPEAGSWRDWPADYRHPEGVGVAAFAAEQSDRVRFFEYLQWQAALQLDAAGRRAFEHRLDIGIYQDLAVSIDGGGAEAWADQDVYASGVAIGAPPDEFNPKGQNWGLVPWDPTRLRDAAYGPFIATLRRNMRAAGALRIDHVMGLMRLFWIDRHGNGTYVHYPLDELLGILTLESQRNRCLVVGEDLGTVPEEIRDALPAAGIYSSAVLYFEKEADGRFRAPADYPARALVSVGTHDLPTWSGYWAGNDLEVRRRLDLFPSAENYEAQVVQRAEDRARLLLALDREGLRPAGTDPAENAVVEADGRLAVAVHRFLARTPSRLMVVQVEDLLGQSEQMNLPGTLDEYPNWQIRSALDIENWGEDARAQALLAALREVRGPAERGEHSAAPSVPVPQAPLPSRADIPRATYRLQFSQAFTFDDAVAIVPYLQALGISHCYASPLLAARPGSAHGYDIVDHTRLNPELGGEAAFERFSDALQAHDMRLILDVVPNHMGVMGRDNGWWLDVLEHGQASPFADTFDIDWRPLKDELRGKVLLPVLGDHYGNVLDSGALTVAFDGAAGSFAAEYFEHRFPLDPREYPRLFAHRSDELAARLGRDHPSTAEFGNLMTAFGSLPPRHDSTPAARDARLRDAAIHKRRLAELYAQDADVAHFVTGVLGDFNGTDDRAGDPMLLHAVLEAQAFRLAYWRVAADEINYRRFFDINELAALSMERREVFDATHRRIFGLIAAGRLQGLRIDHPDGLYDPARYFSRLQQTVASQVKSSVGANDGGVSDKPLYVVIEKIMARDETLPDDWPVHGTTGYEFADLAGGLFVDREQCAAMDRAYRHFTGLVEDYDTVIRRAKTGIMKNALASELSVLATDLARIAEMDTHTRDLTRAGLRDAIEAFVACFAVYRTYVTDDGISANDRGRIESAIAEARRYADMADGSLFDFLRDVLLLRSSGRSEAYRQRILAFTMKFQQFTGPVTAKGVEDTAFYRFNRLVSLNEVGGEPECFGSTLGAFHRANQRRRRHWPHAMLAGSTHDAKRSLDLRMRVHALSDLADDWARLVPELSRINRPHKRVIDRKPAPSTNDEWLLYQTLVGAWPVATNAERDQATADDTGQAVSFVKRLQAYMEKAAREAKLHTSWDNANPDYEAALSDYVAAVLDPGNTAFRDAFLPLQRRAARLGACKSLACTLLELTSPGVPDIYQGDELVRLALVDPDNRRPVDFAARFAALESLRALSAPGAAPANTLRDMLDDSGHDLAKLYVTWCCLELRRRHPALFRRGDYQPLGAAGAAADRLCVYSRRVGVSKAVVVAPFRTAGLGPDDLALGSAWGDTRIALPAIGDDAAFYELFTGREVFIDRDGNACTTAVAGLLRDFPVALLVSADLRPAAD